MTGQPENPSADKFGPPPGQDRFEAPSMQPRRAWFATALWIAYFLVRGVVPPLHGKTWPLAFILVVVFAMAEFMIKRVRHHQQTEDRWYQEREFIDQGMGPGTGDRESDL